MAGKTQSRTGLTTEQRQRRIQKIVFNALAIIIILSWILTLLIQ